MYSIGDLIDKLMIENLKIFTLREKLHDESLSDEEYVKINNQMNILNQNRSTISQFLDEKVDKVVSGKEKNALIKNIKTYNVENDE